MIKFDPGDGKNSFQMIRNGCLIFFILFCAAEGVALAQTLPAGFPVLEEALRRKQLLGDYDSKVSFLQRPVPIFGERDTIREPFGIFHIGNKELLKITKPPKKFFEILPVLNTTNFNSKRPYGWGDGAMVPGKGFSNMVSTGVSGKFYLLKFQFRPEWVVGQNLPYQGFSDRFTDNETFARFRFWNFGDHPEWFSGTYNSFYTLGQSFLSLQLGPVDVGVSNENIWWGPGQFNALIFSRNARGFEHAFLKTNRPVDIYIGNLEAQLIFGRLESSGLAPSQNQNMNRRFFRPFTGDWRYLNALSVSFRPKWLPQFYIGMNRTFQQFSKDVGSSFQEILPVFEVFQKVKLFEDRNSVSYDAKAQDQQVSVFTRYVNVNGNFEIYFEFGKRDHNFNWREFTLNPEHARAYLFGFSKLLPINKEPGRYLQVRGESTHQQESINRYTRYPDLHIGNSSWHTHYQVRGFTHYGESLGVGSGVGANVQTLEVAVVEKLNKVGILLERLENHQDYFYRVFEGQKERSPWVDLSIGLLLDHQWKSLLFSSKVQFVNAHNYQWQLQANTSPEFPKQQKLFSIFAQANLIYFLNQKSFRKKPIIEW